MSQDFIYVHTYAHIYLLFSLSLCIRLRTASTATLHRHISVVYDRIIQTQFFPLLIGNNEKAGRPTLALRQLATTNIAADSISEGKGTRDASTLPIYSTAHSSPALPPAHADRKTNPCTVRHLYDTDIPFYWQRQPVHLSHSDPNCRKFNGRIFPARPLHADCSCSYHDIAALYLRLHPSARSDTDKCISSAPVQLFHSN